MHCLRALRIPSLGSASVRLGTRARPTGLRSKSASCITGSSISKKNKQQQQQQQTDAGNAIAGSMACLMSTSAKRYEGIPKRIYQSAPKRNHGKNAGMRKWSTPNSKTGDASAAAAAEAATALAGDSSSSSSDQQEEMLALGR
ncbi:unnamed protein product, partial [Laminaria digitata]